MLNHKYPGIFILIEGLDGAGKTTAIRKAIAELDSDLDACYLKAVGADNFWGRMARRYAKTFLFLIELFFATRNLLTPALKQGKVVVMDKYYFFVASHVPDVNTRLNRFLVKTFEKIMIRPELLIYFLVDREERIKRLSSDLANPFHRKLAENPAWIDERDHAYLSLIEKSCVNLAYLDTTELDPEQCAEKLQNVILNFLGRGLV